MLFLLIFIFLLLDIFFNVSFAQASSWGFNGTSTGTGIEYSFAPPSSDASLVYLSDLFGVVDGVLAGTGSQIFGHMMGVFNTAVLAFSSIISIYVLILGTVNTAHEGEFLGKQWSSIMVPLRIVTGMAFLVPKASGYCVIQIFFMWVVIQGVGAADKIWNAALSYLNQGGNLVSQQISSNAITGSKATPTSDPVFVGAGKMLSGIVCMYGLQQWIANMHENCQSSNKTSQFCQNGNLPNFLSSIDTDDFTKKNPGQNPFNLPMPNLADAPWNVLNGICGTIVWNPIPKEDVSNAFNDQPNKESNIKTAISTRNIAVQTMYSFLTNVGMAIVNNDPAFNTRLTPYDSNTDAASYAKMQFGVALNDDGQPCTDVSVVCSTWGALSTAGKASSSVLFTGNEFLNAILAYYGVMQPYFSLKQQASSTDHSSREFLSEAQKTGWMFAGAYFFKLINLGNQNSASLSGNLKDVGSSLDSSTDYNNNPTLFPLTCTGITNPQAGSICWPVVQSGSRDDTNALINLRRLLSGSIPPPSSPNNSCTLELKFNSGTVNLNDSTSGYIIGNVSNKNFSKDLPCSSTVYGFIGNSAYYNISGVPMAGNKPLDIHFKDFNAPTSPVNIIPLNGHDCCWYCLACSIGNVLIGLLSLIANAVTIVIKPAMETVFHVLITAPIQGYLFPMLTNGVKLLAKPTLNPVVNLANMGAYFIQNSIDCYFSLMSIGLISGMLSAFPLLSGLATAIAMIASMALPIITTWLAYFVSVGVTTAYYVPLVPYLIFLFGVIGWFFSVIESMIAAPLVALIITSPEGEGLVGKGETGIMILMNVFLRPSLMIIGFVSGIMMSTISVWILSATFQQAAVYLLPDQGQVDVSPGSFDLGAHQVAGLDWSMYPWASILGSLFYIVTFVSVYVTLTQKAFSLIHNVPDKVMRWVGGTQESYGQDTSQWTEETKGAISEAGKKAWQGIGDAAGRPAAGIEAGIKGNLEQKKQDREEKADKGSVSKKP